MSKLAQASKTNAEHVIVGISGGVDSSVTALLLQQQGYVVQGVFMKNWEDDDTEEHCTAADDLNDARQVCDKLGINLRGVNFSDQYWDRVFEYFLQEYGAGRTPNPDILCNKEIKFRAFLDYALTLGADRIATGHYARIAEQDGKYKLLKGKDGGKDQSYFLYTLGQAQLSHSLFPLGELDKAQVRHLAAEHQFVTHDKKDSTGICFIGERNFKAFLKQYLPAKPGDIRTPVGEYLGRHDGLMYYTLGQRQGLGIGGRKGHEGAVWYVADKDLDKNILVVVNGHNHPLLYSTTLAATDLHWVSAEAPTPPYRCMAKTRYRQQDTVCTIDAIHNDICHVSFDEPQWALTPGQSIVFYQHDECLGGGIINTYARAANLESLSG